MTSSNAENGDRINVTRSPNETNRSVRRLERHRIAVQTDHAKLCDTPRATPRRGLPRRRSRRRRCRAVRTHRATPLRRAARGCVRTSGPSAAPRPAGREGGGDPDDQRGSGWSGLPACRSRSCTWSSAFRVTSWSCRVSFLLLALSSLLVLSVLSVLSRSSRSSRFPLLPVVLEEPALLGQHPFRPGGGVPQLDPVDGAVYEHLGLQSRRRHGGAPGSASSLGDRSRPRLSSRPRSEPGSGRTGRRPPGLASPASVARTPRASRARGSPPSSGSGSRPARTGRGTSRAGSPCPSCRASARTSRRSLPPAVSPTTLPGLRPLTLGCTISNHFTPFSSTEQPP